IAGDGRRYGCSRWGTGCRPAGNGGRLRAITAKLGRPPTMHSASASASSQTPRRPSRAWRAWECSSHMARGTMTSPVLVNWSRVASLGSSSQVSGTTWLSLMISRIYALLERVHANALVGIDEALFRGAVLQIHVDQLLHYGGHLIGG